MPAKLVITKKNDPHWHHEREFNQDLITLGRDNGCTFLLEDPEKVISRNHAKLHFEDGKYHLTDTGSNNFTFLNDEKIARHIPYELRDGDCFSIGDYQLVFAEVSEMSAKDATVVLVNPFYEEAKIFASLFKRIHRIFDSGAAEQQATNLKYALEETLAGVDVGDVGEIMAAELTEKSAFPAGESPAPTGTEAKAEKQALPQLTDLLLDQVIRIATVIQEKQAALAETPVIQATNNLHEMSPQTLRAFLFEADVSSDVQSVRLQSLKGQIEELVDAIRTLPADSRPVNPAITIDEIDPTAVEQQILFEGYKLGPLKLPARMVPGYVERRVNETIKERIRERRNGGSEE